MTTKPRTTFDTWVSLLILVLLLTGLVSVSIYADRKNKLNQPRPLVGRHSQR